MNKAELIERIAEDSGISRSAAEKALNAVLVGMTNGLREEKSVVFPGLGGFHVSTRKARRGVNPRTKQKISIPEKKSVRFTVGSRLKAALNR